MVKPLKCHEALLQIEAPEVTPVSVDDCKAHMRVDFADDDTYIGDLIAVAVAHYDAMGVLGKAMVTQKWRQYTSPNPGVVRLSIGPVQAVNAVKYYDVSGDEQTATLTDFDVFGNGKATTVSPKSGFSWPITQDRPDAIWIEYTSGYGDAATDVPQGVRHALKFAVAHWYENREPVSIAKMNELPIGITALINTERACWYG